MKLLIYQKDFIYELIQHYQNLSPSQFEIVEEGSGREGKTKIIFKNSDYYFDFLDDQNHTTYFIKYSPGSESFIEETDWTNWSGAKEALEVWLFSINREITAPNYWERFKNEVSRISFNSSPDNSQFTAAEFKELKVKIASLQGNLDSLPLLADQQKILSDQLERLTEKAESLGKYDWKNLFLGTIISVIIQLNVTPENANALWTLIKRTFNDFLLE